MKKKETTIILIVLLYFIIGIYLYHKMPEKMAFHWSAQGQVNGYASKFWGLFLPPFISLALFIFFALIPKIDPFKANIEKFRKYFDNFLFIIILFLFYLYLLTIFWNMGLNFSMNQALVPGLGTLFFYCGVLLEKVKRNWFIGIRTPWTLSNEKVWDKTHKIGGKLFKAAGLITFLGLIFPGYTLFFVILPLIAAAIYAVIYSYLEYLKESKEN